MTSDTDKFQLNGGWRTNFIVLAITLTLVCVVAEVAIRSIFPAPLDTPWRHRVPDPELGWVIEPDLNYLYLLPEEKVIVKTNSHGFRDVEFAFSDFEAGPRILVLGDSFMEGYSVNFEETFHRQLTKMLAERGVTADSLNFGVGGYGTLQEYLLFMREGRHYKPDIVLLGFYPGNDFRNNLFALEKAAIGSNSNKVLSRPFLLKNSDDFMRLSRVDYQGAQERYREASQYRNSMWQRLRRTFRTLDLAGLAIDRYMLQKSKPVESAASKLVADYIKFGMHYCHEDALFSESLEVTGRIFQELKKEVDAIGAELIVFSVPALHEIYMNSSSTQAEDNISSPQICIEDAPGYQRLAAKLGSLDITYLDLLPAFRKASSSNSENLFRRSDLHWSPAGHRLAAEVVSSQLTSTLSPN